MKKTLLASMIITGLLTGCSTMDKLKYQKNAYTANEEVSDMSKGATIGLAVGAAAATTVTAGVGGFVGAALIGTGFFSWVGLENDMDSREVHRHLREQGIVVENGYETISINFDEAVTFELQKTDIKPQFYSTLEGVAMILDELEDHATFEIVGHTDYTGPEKLNEYLGEERATVIAEKLIEFGVEPSKIVDIKGVKASKIKDGCIDLSCMRTVEILIHKNDILFNL